MALYKRGEVWHYDFAIDGRRFRGSTKEKVLSKARLSEAHMMNEAKRRKLTVQRRTLTLAEFSKRFLEWVKAARLEPESRKYYESGWRMLFQTPIAAMRLSHITTDEAEALRFDHSPANANRALRTLRRMVGKAAEWSVIAAAPRIKLMKEEGRSATIDIQADSQLLEASSRSGTCLPSSLIRDCAQAKFSACVGKISIGNAERSSFRAAKRHVPAATFP